jgi:hypothetical protein
MKKRTAAEKVQEDMVTVEAIVKLREMGHTVENPHPEHRYHFRVDNSFDFFHPRGQWHDLSTNERGNKPMRQMAFFIHHRLEAACTDEQSQASFSSQ